MRRASVDPWEEVAELVGLRLASYKREQVVRRLEGFMRVHRIDGIGSLVKGLRDDPALAEALRSHLTIHVTSFFRDPAYWQHLGRWLAAQRRNQPWRVWCTASATGAEPLSLAALFADLGLPVRILATDVDARVLETASRGRYRPAEVEGLSPAMRRHVLEEDAEGGWTVRPQIRQRITYAPLDLLRDPYPSGPFDLISCRNVLIYFASPDRERVIQQLVQRLTGGGALFLGASEVLLDPGRLGLKAMGSSLYVRQRPEAGHA